MRQVASPPAVEHAAPTSSGNEASSHRGPEAQAILAFSNARVSATPMTAERRQYFGLHRYDGGGAADSAEPEGEAAGADEPVADWHDQPVWTEDEEREPATADDGGAALEREADAHADRVAGPASRPATTSPPAGAEAPEVARFAGHPSAAPSPSSGAADSHSPLHASTRAQMESSLGASFGDVRVHTGPQADRAAQSQNALAYAQGADLTFADGWYAPGTPQGSWLLAHELAHVKQARRGDDDQHPFRVVTTAGVPSLVVARQNTVVLPGAWGTMGRSLGRRDALVTARLALVTPGSAQETALLNMQRRWGTIRAAVASATFSPATGALPTVTAINAARVAERADRTVLSGRANRTLRDESIAFIEGLRTYLRARETRDLEVTEYARFDTFFDDPDVIALLTAIPHASVRRADLKALVSQETGDLTNTTVAGIGYHGRTPSTRRNRGGHVGLGQHTAAARNEAITWAAAQGVTIPARPDPRLSPATSIKLTAAYLGKVMQSYLFPGLPSPSPSGDELKKMLFAAYNGGPANVTAAATSFQAGTANAYTWNDISGQPTVSAQMRNYVTDIVTRLS